MDMIELTDDNAPIVKYRCQYEVYNSTVHVNHINIDYKFRGNSLIRSIIERLLSDYPGFSINLESWITLVPMYRHLGFVDNGVDINEYHEMELKPNTYLPKFKS